MLSDSLSSAQPATEQHQLISLRNALALLWGMWPHRTKGEQIWISFLASVCAFAMPKESWSRCIMI